MLIGRMGTEWSLSSSLSMPALAVGVAAWLDGQSGRRPTVCVFLGTADQILLCSWIVQIREQGSRKVLHCEEYYWIAHLRYTTTKDLRRRHLQSDFAYLP
ncbi:hypothetical protein BKA64DRAFT_465380 [Cadophora sp. MPI-SDFR-AT-0126]|nr:hypothetical protein BKA64DRAFT_465380 [Leotiomycetes sp. MPI-SDFR-AT-0126]